jgi:hypothetical protein
MAQRGGSTWSRPKKCFYESPPGKRPQICKYVRGPDGGDLSYSEIKGLDDCD